MLVAPRACDAAAGADRADEHPGRHGDHHQAGGGGRGAVDHLQVGGQVGDGREHDHAHADGRRGGHHEVAHAEQVQRDDRLRGAALHQHEQHAEHQDRPGEAEDPRARPRVRRAGPRGEEHERHAAQRQQRRAQHVEAHPSPGDVRQVQEAGDEQERHQAQRQVDVEHPPPAHEVREEPADQRPAHRGETEGRPDHAHVPAALAGRHEVRDDRLRPDQEAAAAQALQRAEDDELRHVLGGAREHGAEQEDHDGQQEDPLAPVEVAQLPVDRQAHGGGEHVRRDHPGDPVEPVQVPDDRGQRRGHDRLVEGGQQDRHEQAQERQPQPAALRAAGVRDHGVSGRSSARSRPRR